jgi:hypothetical protein
MLSFHESTGCCARRSFLSIGSLGLGALGAGTLNLADLLATKARANESPSSGRIAPPSNSVLTGKSVIFVFLQGGPTQIETFDPKPTAPPGVKSATGHIATRLPGVEFGSTFEKLATLADKFTVVRSFTTGDGNHDIKPIVGKHSDGANLGALYARVAGSNHPHTGMPLNVALFPRAVEPASQPEQTGFGRFTSTGAYGAALAPFVPGAGGDLQQDMQLALPRDRFDDRRLLLERIDGLRRSADRADIGATLDRFRQQAFDTILGGVVRAFDWTQESPTTIARYDTKPLVPADTISPKWNNLKFYIDHNATLGKLLLTSRRLIEAGCGFVTVTTNFVWDHHADSNNAGVVEGMRYCGVALDHALSALVEDLEARGMGRDVLVVVCGEMGRTPRINGTGGRDHWGGLAPLFLYGGGLRAGQVIGQSTRDAGEPLDHPVRIPDLVGTVLRTVFDGGQLRLRSDVPTGILRMLSESEGIVGV